MKRLMWVCAALIVGWSVGSSTAMADDQIVWSTYLGGSDTDIDEVGEIAYEVARNDAGDFIVVGRTPSADFPTTPGAFQEDHHGGEDLFVASISSDGSQLLFSTFIGGSGVERPGGGLVIGDDGAIWIAGETNSVDFPTTEGAWDRTYGGGEDGFVLALSPDGSTLLYSSFLGDAAEDIIFGLDLASDGSPTVTGRTRSTGFPVTAGVLDDTHNGDIDVFVTRLDPTLSGLNFSTLLGSSGREEGYEIVVASDGSMTVVGRTRSATFPSTPGAFDPDYNGGQDAFIARLDATASQLIFSTFLGGESSELADDFYLKPDGSVVMRGWTGSTDFPTTADALQPSYAGGDNDVFVTRLSSDGSQLTYSTLLGGSDNDVAFAIAPAARGGILVAGQTLSSDFPVTSRAIDPTHNGDLDGFLVWIGPSGERLGYSTYLGGSARDAITYLLPLGGNDLMLQAHTGSPEFPVTLGAFDTTHNGGNEDVALARFRLPDFVESDRLEPNSGPYSGGFTAVIKGWGFDAQNPPVVLFGGVRASTVNVLDIETVEVTVPRYPNPGPILQGGRVLLPSVSVDVTVVAGNGADTLERGFTYSAKR